MSDSINDIFKTYTANETRIINMFKHIKDKNPNDIIFNLYKDIHNLLLSLKQGTRDLSDFVHYLIDVEEVLDLYLSQQWHYEPNPQV